MHTISNYVFTWSDSVAIHSNLFKSNKKKQELHKIFLRMKEVDKFEPEFRMKKQRKMGLKCHMKELDKMELELCVKEPYTEWSACRPGGKQEHRKQLRRKEQELHILERHILERRAVEWRIPEQRTKERGTPMTLF